MRKTQIIGILLTIIVLVLGACSPTTTPTPLTSAEQAYATTMATNATLVGEAFTTLSSLMAYPQIGNETWTFQAAAQLVMIQLLYDEAMALNPPNSMANIHNKYIQAMSHYNSATTLIAQGIDFLNADLINQATTEITIGTQIMGEATQLLTEFIGAHS